MLPNMTLEDDKNNVADPDADPTQSHDPSSKGKTYSEEQYQRAVNRKLANYIPKTDYQNAIERIKVLEGEIGARDSKLAEVSTKLTALEQKDLKLKVLHELGLPSSMSSRISGADEAALKADAESLRKELGIKTKLGDPVPVITDPNKPKTENEEMNSLFLGMVRGTPAGR
jgi:hypothetical protein